jgi:hypothetical protein
MPVRRRRSFLGRLATGLGKGVENVGDVLVKSIAAAAQQRAILEREKAMKLEELRQRGLGQVTKDEIDPEQLVAMFDSKATVDQLQPSVGRSLRPFHEKLRTATTAEQVPGESEIVGTVGRRRAYQMGNLPLDAEGELQEGPGEPEPVAEVDALLRDAEARRANLPTSSPEGKPAFEKRGIEAELEQGLPQIRAIRERVTQQRLQDEGVPGLMGLSEGLKDVGKLTAPGRYDAVSSEEEGKAFGVARGTLSGEKDVMGSTKTQMAQLQQEVDNYRQDSGEFRVVESSARTIADLQKKPGPGTDALMVYAFAAMAQPTLNAILLGESEAARRAAVGGLGSQWAEWLNQALTGTMQPSTRNEMLRSAQELYTSKAAAQDERDAFIADRLGTLGLDPSKVIMRFPGPFGDKPSQGQPSGPRTLDRLGLPDIPPPPAR